MFREKQKDVKYTVEQLRKFEDDVAKAFEEAKIKGPVHLSYGNEDYLIDLFQYVHTDDWVFSTWRNHYHALLHDVPEDFLMSKILDAHSISFQYPEKRFFTSAIVNGIIPIAVGTALGIKLLNENRLNTNLKPRTLDFVWLDKRMVWCFVGDMAASSGPFHEALKYSVFNELPIHFVIENNRLSTTTPTAISWGLQNDYNNESIEAGLTWLTQEQRKKYVSYFEYKREKYPHQGIGKFISF